MPDTPDNVTLGPLELRAVVWGNKAWQYQIVLHAVHMESALNGGGRGVDVVLDYQFFDLGTPKHNKESCRSNAVKYLAAWADKITGLTPATRDALEHGIGALLFLDKHGMGEWENADTHARLLRELAGRGVTE